MKYQLNVTIDRAVQEQVAGSEGFSELCNSEMFWTISLGLEMRLWSHFHKLEVLTLIWASTCRMHRALDSSDLDDADSITTLGGGS
jgi:hypothetical protein